MDSGSLKLTFSLKNGRKGVRIAWGRSLPLKVKKFQIRLFKGLLTTLFTPIPLRLNLSRCSGSAIAAQNPTIVGCFKQ